jgi:hypothetical protein
MIAVNTSAHAMRKAKALAHGVAGQEASERNETGIELLLLCTNLTRNSGSDK